MRRLVRRHVVLFAADQQRPRLQQRHQRLRSVRLWPLPMPAIRRRRVLLKAYAHRLEVAFLLPGRSYNCARSRDRGESAHASMPEPAPHASSFCASRGRLVRTALKQLRPVLSITSRIALRANVTRSSRRTTCRGRDLPCRASRNSTICARSLPSRRALLSCASPHSPAGRKSSTSQSFDMGGGHLLEICGARRRTRGFAAPTPAPFFLYRASHPPFESSTVGNRPPLNDRAGALERESRVRRFQNLLGSP